MILTWRVAKCFMQRIGTWKLYKLFFVLTSEQKPLDPTYKPVRGVITHHVKRDLLVSIHCNGDEELGAQVPDFEFKGLGTSSASPSKYRPCGAPSQSSTRECRSCGIASESSTCECGSCGIPSESCTSTPYGLICIKGVGLTRRSRSHGWDADAAYRSDQL